MSSFVLNHTPGFIKNQIVEQATTKKYIKNAAPPLNPPSGTISILNDRREVVFALPVKKPSEIEDFYKKYAKSASAWSIKGASLIPVSLKAKDILAPTFFNRALKADSLFKKIILGILALAIDFLTFIPRFLLGTPSRALYNYFFQNDHALVDFLKTQNLRKPLSDILTIEPVFIKENLQNPGDGSPYVWIREVIKQTDVVQVATVPLSRTEFTRVIAKPQVTHFGIDLQRNEVKIVG